MTAPLSSYPRAAPDRQTVPDLRTPLDARGASAASDLRTVLDSRASGGPRTEFGPRDGFAPRTDDPRAGFGSRAAHGASATADPRSAWPPAGGEARETEPPAARVAGNRLLIVLLFWGMFATSVGLWVFATPPSTLSGKAEIVTGIGRVTGMIGGFLLLTQVLMMSRVSWLETWIGGHDLIRWHRWIGGWLLVSVLAHAGYTTVGYALTSRSSVVDQTVTLWTDYDDMVGAFTAAGIMVGVGALAIRGVRRRMPYELWHWLHLTTYAILILGYGHQFSAGAELSEEGFARLYWTALYALVISCLVWGRVIEPLWFNLRHRLCVMDVVPESDSMVSIYVGGRNLDRLEARAGQYFRWRFLGARGWWQSHPFSLSAAPNGTWLRLTVSAAGRYTAGLGLVRPGTRVFACGPSGTFTAQHRVRRAALLIAGGSGIAPVRALLEELPRGTVVVYRAGGPADIVFGDELRGLAQRRGIDVRYVLGSRDEPGPRRLFTPEGMREIVPDVKQRDVYLCGPPGMVRAALATLSDLRVRRRQIHLDPFEF
ncbi:ferredoxin reductase family protein [Spirillospora albida]|uniref:ferredoxin reductase family protein n=1 Tax=Spirillospora albida TaxID=58123 RepID=UPI00068FCF52|nr:ferric reductase-like transmembrane domain-containing protein [Spirillospora albida]